MKNLLTIFSLVLVASTASASNEVQVSVCAKEVKASNFLGTAIAILDNELDLTERKRPEARYMAHDLKISIGSIAAAQEIVNEQLINCRKKNPSKF